MRSVTLTAPSYKELKSLFFVRRLYAPPDMELTPTQHMELCKRFSKGYEKLKDREETKEMVKRVNNYTNELEATGINDHEIRRIDYTYKKFVRESIWSTILFHLYLFLCIPAIVVLFPIAFYIKKKAEKERIAVILYYDSVIL